MPIRTSDRLRSKPRGTPAQAVETFRRWGSFPIGDVEDAVDEIYRLCWLVWLDASILVSHAALETGDERRGRAFLDENWAVNDAYQSSANRYNIAGIGITDGVDHGYGFANGITAARGFVVHHARYEIPADDPAWDHLREYIPLDPRFDAVPVANRGIVKTVAELTGKWWTNSDGHINLASRGNAIYASLPDQSSSDHTPHVPDPDDGKEPNMPEGYTVVWPGLPGGAITFSFPVYLNIVPLSRANRPGIKARAPRRSVQHENGNRNAGARADSNYCFNGSGGRQASWHFSVDHKEGFINLPADEIGWHAGDGSGPGNYCGLATELCQLSYMLGAAEGRQARRNAAEIMGRAAGARLKAQPPHEKHQTFSGKWCPEFLLNNPSWWADYVKDWLFFRADELKRMAGGGTTEPPKLPHYGLTDVLATTERMNFRRTPSINGTILSVLPVDTEMIVTGKDVFADDYTWIPVTAAGETGFVAKGGLDGSIWYRMVTDNPDPLPVVDAVPIPALLETDVKKEENVVAVITDDTGNEFTYVRDVIEFTKVTVAGEFAVDNPRSIRDEPFRIGDRALAAWLCRRASDGKKYYILTGPPGEEWARVPVENTKWISDAPLQGDDEVDDDQTVDEIVDDIVDTIGEIEDGTTKP